VDRPTSTAVPSWVMGFSAARALLASTVLALFLGCGSEDAPLSPEPDGGAAAVMDGGATSDGGMAEDGGNVTDGGIAADGGASDTCGYATFLRADVPEPYGPFVFTSTSVSMLCDSILMGEPEPDTLIAGDVSFFFPEPEGAGFWVESLNAPDVFTGPETSTVTALIPARFEFGAWREVEGGCLRSAVDIWIATASITPEQEVSRGEVEVWTRPDLHAAGSCWTP